MICPCRLPERVSGLHFENCYLRESKDALELRGVSRLVLCHRVQRHRAAASSRMLDIRSSGIRGACPFPKQLWFSWNYAAWCLCGMIKACLPESWVLCTAHSLLSFAVLVFFKLLDLKFDWIITEFVTLSQHWALPSLLFTLSLSLLQETHVLLPKIYWEVDGWYYFLARS